MTPPLRVLYVCTANICRSAYADVRSRSLVSADAIAFASAGVWGFDRAPLEELDAILASILIQRRSGGNLAELFAGTADLLQRDIKLRRELGVLTAQARFSAQVVGLMPFALFALLALINPGYVQTLVSHPLGYALLALALVLEVLGFLAIRRIADIKF